MTPSRSCTAASVGAQSDSSGRSVTTANRAVGDPIDDEPLTPDPDAPGASDLERAGDMGNDNSYRRPTYSGECRLGRRLGLGALLFGLLSEARVRERVAAIVRLRALTLHEAARRYPYPELSSLA